MLKDRPHTSPHRDFAYQAKPLASPNTRLSRNIFRKWCVLLINLIAGGIS